MRQHEHDERINISQESPVVSTLEMGELEEDELMDELFGSDLAYVKNVENTTTDPQCDVVSQVDTNAQAEAGEHQSRRGGGAFTTQDMIQPHSLPHILGDGNLRIPTQVPQVISDKEKGKERSSFGNLNPSIDSFSPSQHPQPDPNEVFDLQTAISNISHLKSQILSSHSLLLRLSHLRSQYLALHSRYVSEKAINAQHTQTISSLRDQLSSYDHDNPLLQFQLTQLKSEYQKERALRTSLEEELVQTNRKLALADQAMKKLEEQCANDFGRANKRTHELEKEVDKYKTKVVALLAERKKLEAEQNPEQDAVQIAQDLRETTKQNSYDIERLKQEIEKLRAENAASIRFRARSSQLTTRRTKEASETAIDIETTTPSALNNARITPKARAQPPANADITDLTGSS